MRSLILALVLGLRTHHPPLGQDVTTVVQAVAKGTSCQRSEGFAQLDCEYRVGKGLYFSIAGVGRDDAAVTFFKVDWDADYYATVGVGRGHQCVIVKAGAKTRFPLAMAFVSPRSGKVFDNWQACDSA